jgi:hypothetical protein
MPWERQVAGALLILVAIAAVVTRHLLLHRPERTTLPEDFMRLPFTKLRFRRGAPNFWVVTTAFVVMGTLLFLGLFPSRS